MSTRMMPGVEAFTGNPNAWAKGVRWAFFSERMSTALWSGVEWRLVHLKRGNWTLYAMVECEGRTWPVAVAVATTLRDAQALQRALPTINHAEARRYVRDAIAAAH